MAEVDKSKIKEIENEIRDIINWIKVWNLEEREDGAKRIDDETVEELKEKLENLAKKVSGI